jgi:DNA topoisomerase II
MVKELENQVDRLNNQARFIQMIIEKKLVVSGRKKADIVIELRDKNFRPFPKILKAKESGENEEAVEDDATTGANSDFDYLLGMPIWSLTREKV